MGKVMVKDRVAMMGKVVGEENNRRGYYDSRNTRRSIHTPPCFLTWLE
jgi:hypothetical protein